MVRPEKTRRFVLYQMIFVVILQDEPVDEIKRDPFHLLLFLGNVYFKGNCIKNVLLDPSLGNGRCRRKKLVSNDMLMGIRHSDV